MPTSFFRVNLCSALIDHCSPHIHYMLTVTEKMNRIWIVLLLKSEKLCSAKKALPDNYLTSWNAASFLTKKWTHQKHFFWENKENIIFEKIENDCDASSSTEFISFSMTVGHQSNWHFSAREINWLLLVMNMLAAEMP